MKKGILFIGLIVSFGAMAQNKPAAKTGAPTTKPKIALTYIGAQSLKTTKDSASYALGYRIAQSLKGQGLQDVNFELFKKGMAAGTIAKTDIPDSILDVCIKNYQDKMSQEKITANRAAGAAFLAENAKKLATQVKDKAKKLFKSLIDNIKKFAKQLIDKVKDYAKNAWKYLTELSDKIVGDKIKDLQKKEGVKLAKQAAKKVGKAAVKIAARTAAVASGPVGWVVLIIWTLWDGLTDAWDTWQETGDWYKTLVAGISGLVDSLTFGLFDKETAAKVINGTVDFLKDIPKNIGKFVSDTAKAIDDIVTNNLNGVDDRFKMDDIKKEEILRQIIEEIKDKSGSALDFNGLDQNLLDAKVYKDPYKEFVELDVNLLDAQYLTNAFDNELLTAFQTGYNSLTGTYIFDKNSYWMVTRPKNNQNATILINKQTGYMININQAGSSTSIQTQDSTTNTIIINQKGN
jgi:phage anti-repressor protein